MDMVSVAAAARQAPLKQIVAAVYTGRGLDDQVAAAAREIIPGVRVISLIDDGLIADINASGSISPSIVRRALRCYESAADAGAAVVLNTCSSIGELVALGRRAVAVPIVRIDEPMAEEAVARFRRTAVVATLPSTLGPTSRLLSEKASSAGRDVQVYPVLAEGAYEALVAGDGEGHDRLVEEAVGRAGSGAEAIVMAQASMARMQARLERAAGVPVLSSLRPGLLRVRQVLENLKEAS
ncbi:MAG: aspartate/glutamate racemase family protein [Acidimicrobiales bacterium]|jgi:Asp/Glu/hydantoin racemase